MDRSIALGLFLGAPLCAASLLLSPEVARADVALPNTHIVASEAVLTGLVDFPAYRFVIAAVPISRDSGWPESMKLPLPVAVHEGEHVSTSSIYFQEVRAIPADAPEPVTDEWLAASHAPTSGSFTLHPLRVADGSTEKVARAHYHVRQIRSGRVALELMSAVTVMGDGSEHPYLKPVPVSYEIASVEAPPGWQLYLMPDPSWPRDNPPLPAVRCKAGDVLPLSPGPRTLIAVQGDPGPDGSIANKPFVTWGYPLDAWHRTEVLPESKVVAVRQELEIEVDPGRAPERRLSITRGERYQDASGDWFEDEGATLPVRSPPSEQWQWWWAAFGGAGVTLVLGAWIVRRRRRARRGA